MERDYKPWSPVVLWMGFIFLMSTDAASASHTSRIIEPLLHWVRPDISDEAVGLVHLLVRKFGHLFEYGVLAHLVRRALMKSAHRPTGEWSWRAAGWAWVVATAYAATDELHQTLVATRTPSSGDVLIDSIGALVALTATYLWLHPLRPRINA